MLSIDCQFGFGADSWEVVPHADAAVENFRRASRARRECGGTVAHVQTVYTPQREPSGRITDFEPGIADALAAGTRAAEAYPDLVLDGDLVVYKTTVDGLSMAGLKVIVLADACAAQAIGTLTAPQAAVAGMMGLCDLTRMTGQRCLSRVRKKPASAGARLRSRTMTSDCARTARRTGTSESRE